MVWGENNQKGAFRRFWGHLGSLKIRGWGGAHRVAPAKEWFLMGLSDLSRALGSLWLRGKPLGNPGYSHLDSQGFVRTGLRDA